MINKKNKVKKINKITKEIILDNTNVPRNKDLYIQISREFVLDKLFYVNYNLDEKFIEDKIKELEDFYVTKINEETDKVKIEKLLENKELKLKQLTEESLFKTPDINNRALLIITHLCFCRLMKGNSTVKAGRKTKEQENKIFCNKNNELRINIKDFTSSLGYDESFKQVSKIKEVLTELDKLKWIKFKKYKDVKNIYTITLNDDIFNYKTKEFIEESNTGELKEILKGNRGFINLNAEEYFLILNCTTKDKSCKIFNLLSTYLGLKDLAPKGDIKNVKTISYLGLSKKTNISNVTLINVIDCLGENKLIEIKRGDARPIGNTIQKPQNIYKLLF